MKLYSHMRSPWCRKVEWALAEMNLTTKLDIEVISAKPEAQKEAMQRLKKLVGEHATVPALITDSFSLLESSAIVFYLAEKLKFNDTFLPNTAEARAEIHQWDRVCDINLGANIVSPWLRNTLFLGNNVADSKVFEKCKENFAKLEERLGQTLQGKPYLLGSHFTYADLGTTHLFQVLGAVEGPRITQTEVLKWFKLCASREANKVLLERQMTEN
jgi:glutathione S-transferase